MPYFSIEEHKSYLAVSFCAPDSANALSLAAARELSALQKKYRKWSLPVVISSHHPTMFCSGGNLSDYKKLKTKAAGLKVNREITGILDAFGKWPVVKLAIVNGDVLGGGIEWLGRFDFRWCTPHILCAFWQRRIGLSTGWGGGRAWAAKIGEDRVRQLLMEARLFGASEAVRLGVFDRVVTPWKLDLEEWAASVAPSLVTEWSAAREEKHFSSLWMVGEHAAVLKKWRSR